MVRQKIFQDPHSNEEEHEYSGDVPGGGFPDWEFLSFSIVLRVRYPAADGNTDSGEKDADSGGGTAHFSCFVYEEREAVGAALTPLNSGQFVAISQCLQALSPFNHVRVELSAEKVVTASKIRHVRMLFHKFNEKAHKLTTTTVIDLTNNLITNLKQHFGDLESLRMLAEAALLDPKFKTVAFGSALNADSAIKGC